MDHIGHLNVRSPSETNQRTSLNSYNVQLFERQDDHGELISLETNFKSPITAETTVSQSGRRSSIPVLVRRRSHSACGDSDHTGRMGQATPITDYINSYVAAQMNMRKVVPSLSNINADDRGHLGNFNSPSQHRNSSKISSEGQTKYLSRPQSAAGFTQRTTPASGRILPVVPSGVLTVQGKTGRSLPFTPIISNVAKAKPHGRTLPTTPNTNVQNLNKPSGRTLPTTPANTGMKLPTSILVDRCRSQLPKKSSQSQPGSRSTSPSSKLAYITHTQPLVVNTSDHSVSSRPRSCIPRGQSRDTSPKRRNYQGGDEFVASQRLPVFQVSTQKDNEMEAVNAALLRHNLVSRLQMENNRRDDAASETSSMSSDSVGRNPHAVVMDVSIIIELLSSGVWTERRDGLLSLENFLKSDGQLSTIELKKTTELFTRMFHEPNPKVFVVFLEIIPAFVSANAADVPSEWLYTCLSRLLERTSVDLLKSVHDRLQAALKSVRDTFAVGDQWASLARFVCESAKIADAKVRQSFVDYLHDMVVSMDSTELLNSSNVQQVVLRTIAWMLDRRFPNISRTCQHITIALFNVNTPEFTTVLSSLPRSMRDNAFKLLQQHMATVSHGIAASDSNHPTLDNRSTPLRSRQQNEENLSAEDFYASFKKTAEDIQNLNVLD